MAKHPRPKPRVLQLRLHQKVLEWRHCRWPKIRITTDETRASERPTMKTTRSEQYPARIAHSLYPRRQRRIQLQARWTTAALSFGRERCMSEYQSQPNSLRPRNPNLLTLPTLRTPSHPSLSTDGPAHAHLSESARPLATHLSTRLSPMTIS
jgi:hypothetical protein